MRVKDLETRDDLMLISEIQNIKAVFDTIGYTGGDDYDCLLVKAEDGDIVECWGIEGIPYLDKQFRLWVGAVHTAAAEQHPALLGIAHGVGKEVLQNTAQQMGVAGDLQRAGDGIEADPALCRDDGKLITEGLQNFRHRESFRFWPQCAAIQFRDVHQRIEYLFRRLQGFFYSVHQPAGIAVLLF